MTPKITRVVGLVLALLLTAACGVKSSTIRDREASRRLAPQDIAADYTAEAGDAGLETPADAEIPPSAADWPQPDAARRRHPRSGSSVIAAKARRRPSRAQHAPVQRSAASSELGVPDEPPARRVRSGHGPAAPHRLVNRTASVNRHRASPSRAVPRPLRPSPGSVRRRTRPDGRQRTRRSASGSSAVTVAAPVPQKAFERARPLWKFLAGKGGVHGRNVEVVFRGDDEYNPTSAVQSAGRWFEKQKVFAHHGFAGDRPDHGLRPLRRVGQRP